MTLSKCLRVSESQTRLSSHLAYSTHSGIWYHELHSLKYQRVGGCEYCKNLRVERISRWIINTTGDDRFKSCGINRDTRSMTHGIFRNIIELDDYDFFRFHQTTWQVRKLFTVNLYDHALTLFFLLVTMLFMVVRLSRRNVMIF